jgi:hypothetical protein
MQARLKNDTSGKADKTLENLDKLFKAQNKCFKKFQCDARADRNR